MKKSSDVAHRPASKSQSREPTLAEMMGHVRADNIDPNDENAIKFGFVVGDGLLGELVDAIADLALTAEEYGYTVDIRDFKQLQREWLRVFRAMKRIEEMVADSYDITS